MPSILQIHKLVQNAFVSVSRNHSATYGTPGRGHAIPALPPLVGPSPLTGLLLPRCRLCPPPPQMTHLIQHCVHVCLQSMAANHLLVPPCPLLISRACPSKMTSLTMSFTGPPTLRLHEDCFDARCVEGLPQAYWAGQWGAGACDRALVRRAHVQLPIYGTCCRHMLPIHAGDQLPICGQLSLALGATLKRLGEAAG